MSRGPEVNPVSVWRLLAFVWRHPANAGHRGRAVARAIGWQIYKRVTGRSIDLDVFNGQKFRCYPDSPVSSLLVYASGWPDFHEMEFMRHYLRRGDAFIDAGANVGVYTILAASLVGADGHVESFEPGSTASSRLRENVELNACRQVSIHEMAVGNRNQTVSFLADQDAENRIATAEDQGKATVERPCVRLDDFLPTVPYSMGKMDLEGAEALALEGAERLISAANPPVWLLEFNGAMRAFGFDEPRLAGWLAARGFDLAVYDSGNRTLRFGDQLWRDAPNLIAVSRRLRETVINRLDSRAPAHG